MTIRFDTDRLTLLPYELTQAEKVAQLAGEWEVAATTFVPHPYTIEDAEQWINLHNEWMEQGSAYPLAINLKDSGELVGTMTLRVDKKHHKGELAYWVGKPYWGRGYATEAAERLTQFGFEELGLQRIWSAAITDNPASTKVMQKVGLSYEGTLKNDIYHHGEYKDIAVYGLIREDYRNDKSN